MNLHYLYHHKTPVGALWIAPQPGSPGRFWLGIDDEALGSYHSPESAAGDVPGLVTGWHEIDSLDLDLALEDLCEWAVGHPEDL